jgi:DNA-binding NarL/FixJ family response regulator
MVCSSSPEQPSVVVLVAEADAMAARLLTADLRRQRQLRVIECAPQVTSILDCIAEHSPNILLLGDSLRDNASPDWPKYLAGLALLRRIRREHPGTRGIVLVEAAEPHLVAELFRAGAKGIFDRSSYDVKRLSRCIRCVANGQVWASSEQVGFALDAFAETASLRIVSAAGVSLLTKRETDVVRLVAEGLGNREVAQQLGLSEHTVKNYLFNVFDKLGISSRAELVMYTLSNSDNRLLRADELSQPSTLSNRRDAENRQVKQNAHSRRVAS